ncbi:MAG: aldehyde dehydrogenase family protein [Ilumatobacteraceae bacterium]|nr:aldehyde dehydrogenase family protein [Ilumatobacteraceae bacterium]
MSSVDTVPTQSIVSPIDGSTLATRELADNSQIENILAKAAKAKSEWQSTSIADRIRLCERMVQYLEANANEIGLEITQQMGRPIRYTPNEILRGVQERARYMMSIAQRELCDLAVPHVDGFTKFIRRNPVGTVLVVAPWNYPYLTAINSVVPALLSGNTIIMKHASQTLLCAERFSDACAAAGFPDGVFQHVHASHVAVSKMISDWRINFVVFTGSVEGGAAMERAAAGRFIGVGTELGGKDPSYVRADADLALAIADNVDGSFFNSGQSCCGIERIYVHADVYDDFVDGFADLTRKYVLGDPLQDSTTLGPMVNTNSAQFVRDQIAAAIAQGARAIVNEYDFAASRIDSPYLGPTVLLDVDHSMSVMRDESFGPVIGIMKVSGDQEAVALMNDSPYGLTACLWTKDIERAEALGHLIETGTCFMNRCDYLDPSLVWTGVKNTGSGIALSELGFGPYTKLKSFHLKHS